VDPEEFLAFVHHADETAKARVFGFEQGVEFAQGGAVRAEGDAMFKGVIFKGDKGYLLCDYDFRILMPLGDLTYYKSPKKEDLIPPSKGHHKEWIAAAKGDKKTTCNFDYSGAEVENNLLALVAYRVGKPLQWDPKALKAPGCPEADQYIQKKYREGWTLNG